MAELKLSHELNNIDASVVYSRDDPFYPDDFPFTSEPLVDNLIPEEYSKLESSRFAEYQDMSFVVRD